jgi:hypothetical protein
MKFRDIPQYTRCASAYQVDVSWRYLDDWMSRMIEQGLQLKTT